ASALASALAEVFDDAPGDAFLEGAALAIVPIDLSCDVRRAESSAGALGGDHRGDARRSATCGAPWLVACAERSGDLRSCSGAGAAGLERMRTVLRGRSWSTMRADARARGPTGTRHA